MMELPDAKPFPGHETIAELIAADRVAFDQMNKGRKTLPDEFAMAALTGVMESIGSANPTIVAEEAYAIARAMMKAREQEKP